MHGQLTAKTVGSGVVGPNYCVEASRQQRAAMFAAEWLAPKTLNGSRQAPTPNPKSPSPTPNSPVSRPPKT